MIIKSIALYKDQNITLEKCLRVNYLVGPNGSGKSRALTSIRTTDAQTAELYPHIQSNPHDYLRYQPISISNRLSAIAKEKEHKERLKNQSIKTDDIDKIQSAIEELLGSEYGEIKIRNGDPQEDDSSIRIPKIQYRNIARGKTTQSIDLSDFDLSGGELALWRIFEKLYEANPNNRGTRSYKQKVFLIDEPETGLHPKIQKLLPDVFEKIAALNEERGIICQFFVATHSPFIISAAARLNDQKIYLFNNGTLVGLDGKSKIKSSGFTGPRCLNVVADILGAGFNDLSATPETKEQYTIVYCEGQKKTTKDSILYKNIFPEHEIIFVSCADLDSAVHAFRTGVEGAMFMFGKNTRVRALVDRSFSFHDLHINGKIIKATSKQKPIFTDEERVWMMKSDPERRIQILLRKEIENYLFDPSVVSFLEDSLKRYIEIPEDLDCINGEVKDRVNIINKKPEILKMLASIIFEKKSDPRVNQIYNELAEYVGAQVVKL